MADLTLPLNYIAVGIGATVAGGILVAYLLQQRKAKKNPPSPATVGIPAKIRKTVLPKETPEIRVVTESPPRQMSDNLGTFLWFWVCIAAIISAPIALGLSGVNIVVAVLYFGIFPIVGTAAGYIFHRYRVSGPARDFDKMLKVSNAIAFHIGTDDKARLVGGRRGSTGRWHLPNMEITSDAIRKAIFPFYGSVVSIIHSVSDSQLNPEFLYYATVLNRNSEQIGADGRPKLSHEIADTIQGMVDREEELLEMQEQMRRINNGETTLSDVLDERYRHVLYPDGVKLDVPTFDKLNEYWTGMLDDDGWAMKMELAEIDRAMSITIEEKGFHIEFEKDMRGKIIGAHLVHDRVIDLHDFRNYLPTGGTAESSHLASENARLAGQAETGVTQQQYMKWLLLIMTPVMVGVAVFIIAYALKSL